MKNPVTHVLPFHKNSFLYKRAVFGTLLLAIGYIICTPSAHAQQDYRRQNNVDGLVYRDTPPAVPKPNGRIAEASPETLRRTTEAVALEANPVTPPTVDTSAAPAPTWLVLTEQSTLRTTLQHWAKTAGWTLIWELPVDHVIEANAQISGTFEQAVGALAVSSQVSRQGFRAIFYNANRVVRIVPWENQS